MLAERRAARGAAMLDEVCPEWESRIFISTLDLQSPNRCVLAQVYGDYFDGRDSVGLSTGRDRDVIRHGFDLRSWTLWDGGWDKLKDAWIAEVMERRLRTLRTEMAHMEEALV